MSDHLTSQIAEPEVLPATQRGSEQPEAEPVALAADQSGSELPEAETEAEGNEEGEEEGECGFCLYMKAGGCREPFINWEKCVEEAEKNKEDIVDKCVEVTALLKQCMEAHSDYYAPIISAERAAEQQVVEELEKEVRSQQEQQSAQIRASESEQQRNEEVRASDTVEEGNKKVQQ